MAQGIVPDRQRHNLSVKRRKYTNTMGSMILCLAIIFCLVHHNRAFEPHVQTMRPSHGKLFAYSRRDLVVTLGKTVIPSIILLDPVFAAETETQTRLEMKIFDDPLFTLSVPKSFFTLRRTQKGDLPDAKTGKGRRGSSIFTAGNMAKAEVIAVEVRLSSDLFHHRTSLSKHGNISATLFKSFLRKMELRQLVI